MKSSTSLTAKKQELATYTVEKSKDNVGHSISFLKQLNLIVWSFLLALILFGSIQFSKLGTELDELRIIVAEKSESIQRITQEPKLGVIPTIGAVTDKKSIDIETIEAQKIFKLIGSEYLNQSNGNLKSIISTHNKEIDYLLGNLDNQPYNNNGNIANIEKILMAAQAINTVVDKHFISEQIYLSYRQD